MLDMLQVSLVLSKVALWKSSEAYWCVAFVCWGDVCNRRREGDLWKLYCCLIGTRKENVSNKERGFDHF